MKIMQCKSIITMILLDLNWSLSLYSSLLAERNKTPRKKVKGEIVLLKLNLQGHSKRSQLHSIHFFLEEVDINGADDIGKKKKNMKEAKPFKLLSMVTICKAPLQGKLKTLKQIGVGFFFIFYLSLA